MVQRRLIVNLNDIDKINIACKACGHEMSFKPSRWHAVPENCLNCHNCEISGTAAHTLETLRAFISNFLDRGFEGKIPFRITFEFNEQEKEVQV